MASGAQCDQILFGIISAQTPTLNVVHLEILRAPAELATPPVLLPNLPMQSPVRGFRPQSGAGSPQLKNGSRL